MNVQLRYEARATYGDRAEVLAAFPLFAGVGRRMFLVGPPGLEPGTNGL